MPQHEDNDTTNARFEEELGAVLRRTGDGFVTDDRRELASGGLTRGRRRMLRRRLAMTGGGLALAGIALGGSYGGSLLGGLGGGDVGAVGSVGGVSAPAAPEPGADGTGGGQAEQGRGKPGDEPRIPVADLAAVLKANTPAGTWEIQDPQGRGQSVAAVYDDGKGKAAVTVGLYRADGAWSADQMQCPDKAAVPYDRCVAGKTADGSRLLIVQGYEYPDKRVETKNWRALLQTKEGFIVDASEYNAAAEKDSPITRENPPFSGTQLKALVTAAGWRPLLKQLPPPATKPGGGSGTTEPAAHEPSAAAVQATLRSLLPKDRGLRVVGKGGEGSYAYLVVDDGKGRSLVQINVQPGMTGIRGDVFGVPGVTTEADGTLVSLSERPGEKGGEGVVWWSADTLALDDFRVVVSAFNSGTQHDAATRTEPALTTEQMKTIALSPKWRALTGK
ncbi:hypothetical protein [Streptomyces sp. NPDC093111]|uniref:hypothetical protein n=1 Tax=Streptomyces sp. NPDC093111 TaxID=3154978 RepID=UPI0034303C2C